MHLKQTIYIKIAFLMIQQLIHIKNLTPANTNGLGGVLLWNETFIESSNTIIPPGILIILGVQGRLFRL